MGVSIDRTNLDSYLDGGQDDVALGADANGGGTLLYSLHGVLHLEEPALGGPRRHIIIIQISKLADKLVPCRCGLDSRTIGDDGDKGWLI